MAIESGPPSPEAVEAAMQLLPRVPRTWDTVPELSRLEEEGLGLLVSAGLVERKLSVRLRAAGEEQAVAIRFRFTGQEGLAEAVEPGLAEAWRLWHATWEGGERVYVEPSLESGEWRLTDQGEDARRELADGDVTYLRDVLRTPGVPGTDAMPPNMRFVPGVARPVYAGEGHVERVEVVNTKSEPMPVNVENLDEVSGPLGDIARMMQQGLEHLRGPTQAEEQSREGGSRRGPSRLSFNEALRYVTLLRKWAQVQDRNRSKSKREQTSRLQFARACNTTVPELKRAQSWYSSHRNSEEFPRDPRNLTDEELRRLFPKRG